MEDRKISQTLSGRFQNCNFEVVSIFELFFRKKNYLLVGASSMLWTGQWISESVSERCMYVTPIRSDLL